MASFAITGMEELLQRMEDLKINAPRACAIAGERAMAETVEPVAKARCDVDRGQLRTSIHTIGEPTPLGAIIRTGTNIFYGIYVEYGTGLYAEGPGGSRAKQIPWTYFYKGHKGRKGFRKTYGMHATHFLGTAMEMNQNRLPDLTGQYLGELIDQIYEGKKMQGLAGIRGI